MGLKGRSILTTRAENQSEGLRKELEQLGAMVVEIPAIELRPPDTWEPVDLAIKSITSYDWLIFTSTNAVDCFLSRLGSQSLETPVAAIGPQTASSLTAAGISVSLTPEEPRAEGLIEAFPTNLTGKRILLPRASRAREILPESLRARGAQVDVVSVYQVVVPDAKGALVSLLKNKGVDCITFTSGSAIKNLSSMFDTPNLSSILDGVAVSVIGPVTNEVATQFGLIVDIISPEPTMVALAKEIERYFMSPPSTDNMR